MIYNMLPRHNDDSETLGFMESQFYNQTVSIPFAGFVPGTIIPTLHIDHELGIWTAYNANNEVMATGKIEIKLT